jgi:hypothetical protein
MAQTAHPGAPRSPHVVSRSDRAAPALVAAAAVLVAVWWIDHVVIEVVLMHPYFVLRSHVLRSLSGLDPQQVGTLSYPLWSLEILAIGGAALVLARIAWWSRSAVVGIFYLVVGTSLALLPWLGARFAPERFDHTPWMDIFPTPLGTAVRWVEAARFGSLDALVMIGAVMAITGGFVTLRSFRDGVVVAQPEGDMSNRATNTVAKVGWPRLALGVAAVALVTIGWMGPPLEGVYALAVRDNVVFSTATWGSLLWLGSRLAVAGLVLVLAVLVWRTRAAVVGAIYVVVGAFCIFLPFILENVTSGPIALGFAVQAPTSSSSLTVTLESIWWATIGPISATQMIGGVMVIAGAAVVARSLIDWVAAGETGGPLEMTSQSVVP